MCKWNAFLIDSLLCVWEYGEHRKEGNVFPTTSGWVSLDIPNEWNNRKSAADGDDRAFERRGCRSFGGTGNGRNSFGTQWPDSVGKRASTQMLEASSKRRICDQSFY